MLVMMARGGVGIIRRTLEVGAIRYILGAVPPYIHPRDDRPGIGVSVGAVPANEFLMKMF